MSDFNNTESCTFIHIVKIVGTSAIKACVGAGNLTNRSWVFIQNKDNQAIFVGNNTVTNSGATEGYELGPGESVRLDYEDSLDIYVIASNANSRVLIMEAF